MASPARRGRLLRPSGVAGLLIQGLLDQKCCQVAEGASFPDAALLEGLEGGIGQRDGNSLGTSALFPQGSGSTVAGRMSHAMPIKWMVSLSLR